MDVGANKRMPCNLWLLQSHPSSSNGSIAGGISSMVKSIVDKSSGGVKSSFQQGSKAFSSIFLTEEQKRKQEAAETYSCRSIPLGQRSAAN